MSDSLSVTGLPPSQPDDVNKPINVFSTVVVAATSSQPAGYFATILVTDSTSGKQTDADGTLAGRFLSEQGVGSYTISSTDLATLNADLLGVTFTPTLSFTTTTLKLTVSGDGLTATEMTNINTPPPPPPPPPAITGAVAGQSDNGVPINPFAAMVVTDTNGSTPTETAIISIADPSGTATDADGTLSGTGLTKTGVGTYAITSPVSPAALTTALQNLTFTPVVGTVSTTASFSVAVTETADNLIGKDATTTVITPPSMPPPPPPPPAITGAVAGQSDNGAPIKPFAAMVVTDTNGSSPTDAVTITITDSSGAAATDADGLLSGVGLSKTGVGTYAITSPISPAALTTALQNLTFTPVVGPTATTATFLVAVTDTGDNLIGKDTTTSVITPGHAAPPQSTIAFAPTTLPTEIVASGATLPPFKGLTINSTEPVTSTEIITTTLTETSASDPSLTNPGTISDSTGGGAALTGNQFIEVNTIASTGGNTILGRLQFTAPTLKAGQSLEDNLTITAATSLTAGSDIDSNVATLTVPVDVVTAPAIIGTLSTEPDGDESINPFSTGTFQVVDTDFNNTAKDTATITVSDPSGTPTDADGILTGIGLSKTGVGTYTVPNPIGPATLTTVLQNLKFTPVVHATDTTTSFALAVTDPQAGLTSNTDTTTSIITTGTGNQPPVTTPGPCTVNDTTTNSNLATTAPANGNSPVPVVTPYSGPVTNVTNQYVNITEDNLNIAVTTTNWFLHSGGGEDALQAFGGTNVLDGGTGSNFLVGGKGSGEFDTFFVDARGATADIWSTMVNFASGDNATMWGITASMFNIAMVDNDGAAGFTGLTFHATAAGSPEASLTLTGFTQADLTNGKITETFGTDPASGSPYMAIHAT